MKDSQLVEMGSIIHDRIKSMVLTQVDFMQYVELHEHEIDRELLMHIKENNSKQIDLLNLLVMGGERLG